MRSRLEQEPSNSASAGAARRRAADHGPDRIATVTGFRPLVVQYLDLLGTCCLHPGAPPPLLPHPPPTYHPHPRAPPRSSIHPRIRTRRPASDLGTRPAAANARSLRLAMVTVKSSDQRRPKFT